MVDKSNVIVHVDFQSSRQSETAQNSFKKQKTRSGFEADKALSRAEREALFMELMTYASQVLENRAQSFIRKTASEQADCNISDVRLLRLI